MNQTKFKIFFGFIRKQFLISSYANRFKNNFIYSGSIQDFNPNESEPSFQSKVGLIQTEFFFRINSNASEVGMIRIDISVWINLSSDFEMVRINFVSETFRLELNPTESELFSFIPKSVFEPIRFIPVQSKAQVLVIPSSIHWN